MMNGKQQPSIETYFKTKFYLFQQLIAITYFCSCGVHWVRELWTVDGGRQYIQCALNKRHSTRGRYIFSVFMNLNFEFSSLNGHN
jgi:hypothetical protein